MIHSSIVIFFRHPYRFSSSTANSRHAGIHTFFPRRIKTTICNSLVIRRKLICRKEKVDTVKSYTVSAEHSQWFEHIREETPRGARAGDGGGIVLRARDLCEWLFSNWLFLFSSSREKKKSFGLDSNATKPYRFAIFLRVPLLLSFFRRHPRTSAAAGFQPGTGPNACFQVFERRVRVRERETNDFNERSGSARYFAFCFARAKRVRETIRARRRRRAGKGGNRENRESVDGEKGIAAGRGDREEGERYFSGGS